MPCCLHKEIVQLSADHYSVQNGREGIELEYEQTSEFHEKWRLKSRDMIAQAEWRRRKLGKRVSFMHTLPRF